MRPSTAGARWHQDSIWLHVRSRDVSAQQLYGSRGYAQAPGPGGYLGLLPGTLKALLLTKALQP